MANITSRRQLRGLNTYGNPLRSEPGQSIIADNCVVNRPGCIGNRPGFDYFGSTSLSGSPRALLEYQNGHILHTSDNKLAYDANLTGTYTQYSGTFTPPGSQTLRGANASGNFYFTSTAGIQKISGIANQPVRAGAPYALDTQLSLTGTGGGFMSGSTQVGYQICWTRTDSNSLVVRGAPSYMTVITNANQQGCTITASGGTATVTTPIAHGFTTGDTINIAGCTQTQYNGSNWVITVTSSTTFTYPGVGSPASPATGTPICAKYLNVSVNFSVPNDVVVGDSYEIYRTPQTVDQNTQPGNVAQLVYSAKYSSGTTISYTDGAADSLLQLPLYTNPNQEGLGAYNFRPPVATDVEFFNDYTFFSNTAIDHSYSNTMISATYTNGVSTIVINNGSGTLTYTAAAAENIGARQFLNYTSGSPAVNIDRTLRSLIRVINQDASCPVYAELTSSPSDVLPGKFRFYAKTPTSGAFWLTVNNSTTGSNFQTNLPTSGNAQISSNDAGINRVYFSKFQQPDHCPPGQFFNVGRKDKALLRTVSLRDSIIFIKEDGIFYTNAPIVTGASTGTTTTFIVKSLDANTFCLAPNSVRRLANEIYMFSNQGFVKVNDNSVGVISAELTNDLKVIAAYSNINQTTTFGAALDFERHYICWLPGSSTDTVGTVAYVYHIFEKQWTRWLKPATCAVVIDKNRTLYIGSGLENRVLYQRNTGTYTDYSDEETAITITRVTGTNNTTVTFTYSSVLAAPQAGMSIHQSTTVAKFLSVTADGGSSYTAIIDRPVTFTNGAATVRQPIFSSIQLFPDSCGEAGIVKIFQTVSVMLSSNSVSQAMILCGTNEAGTLSTAGVVRPINLGWGISPWGNQGWGDVIPPLYNVPFRMDVPLGANTGETITVGWQHNVSQEGYYIDYVDITFNSTSEITTR